VGGVAVGKPRVRVCWGWVMLLSKQAMSTFGNFQTVSEIASSGSYKVYSARAAGASGPATHAIKIYVTVDDLADPDVIVRGAAAFERVWEIQRTCHQRFGQGFMPVHALGKTPTAVYAVTDLARETADGVIKGQRDLTSQELLEVLRGAVASLGIAKEVTGLGHGNIKSNNIMFIGEGLGESLRLMDPLDPKLLSATSAREDMRGVGALLFELIEHREAPVGTEIRSNQLWQRMGPRGEGLRALCEELLNPTRGQELTLEGLPARLDAIEAMSGGGGGKKKFLIGGAVLGLVVAVVVAYIMLRPTPVPVPPPVDLKWAEDSAVIQRGNDAAYAVTQLLISKRDELPDAMRAILTEGVTKFSAEWNKIDGVIKGAAPATLEDVAALTTRVNTAQAELAKVRAGVDNAVKRAGLLKTVPPVNETLQSVGERLTNVTKVVERVAAEKREAARTSLEAIKGKWEAASNELNTISKELEEKVTEPIDEAKVAASLQRLQGLEAGLREEISAWIRANSEQARAAAVALDNLSKAVDAMTNDGATELRKRLLRSVAEDVEEGKIENEIGVQNLGKGIDALNLAIEEIRKATKVTLPSNAPVSTEAAQKVADLAATRTIKGIFEGGQLTSVKLKEPLVKTGTLPADIKKIFDDATGSVQTLVQGLSELAQQAVTLEDLLAQGRGYDEKVQNVSIGELQTTLLQSKLRRELKDWGDADAKAFATAFEKHIKRAQAVADLRTANIPQLAEVLAQEVRLAGSPERNLARVSAVLARLPGAGFPANAQELDTFVQQRKQIEELLASAGEERKAEFKKRYDTLLQEGWLKVINGQTLTAEELKVTLAGAQGFGLTSDQVEAKLSPRVKLNRRIITLVEELNAAPATGNPQRDNEEVGKILQRFFADAESLGETRGAPKSAKFGEIATRLGNAADGKGFLNLREEGPGKLGANWSVSDIDAVNNTYVTYVLTNRVKVKTGEREEKVTFEFVRILESTTENKYVYLLATEVSNAQVLAMMRDAKHIGRETEPPVLALLASTNVGVKVWRLSGKSFLAEPVKDDRDSDLRGWFDNDWNTQSRNVKPSFYAQGVEPGVPTAAMPMTSVSISAATYLAALVNCRLPTDAEMREAMNQAGAEPGDSNRRDRNWTTQFNHIKGAGLSLAPQQGMSPGGGIFAADVTSGDDGSPAVQRDDEAVFFVEVNKARTPQRIQGRNVYHLYGNAAEWVLDRQISASDIIKGDRSTAMATTARAAINAKPEGVGVMGASAFSPATIDPKQVYKSTSTSVTIALPGFTDVGFRLAFSTAAGGGAGSGTPYQQAAKIVSELGLIPPGERN
jgi:hypothetical protein